MPAIAPPLNPSELVSVEVDPTLSPSSAVEVAASEDEVVVTWRARQLESSLPAMMKVFEVVEAPVLSLSTRKARNSV